jgi:molecular chaperone GrpE
MPGKPKKPAAVNPETEKLQLQLNELSEALKRERADSINLRRRHEEETSSLQSHIKTNVVSELLPVIDNFERALKHVPKDLEDSDYVKGIRGIVKQFEKTLQDMGVERIKTVGEQFNPKFHEAVSLEEGEGTREIISDELQAGYTINGEVIRHAMVKVKVE